ncbi:MAG: class IV adenylate cyclase [Candidatus Lokiarchaeota archaeon]|nr:class IV adenylate cyclase [Candidatus Lokiarchaeota archaeon]MBD3198997.1 class IV adenylate cyclase [Candidatus Lokiarchaeota archaeon]
MFEVEIKVRIEDPEKMKRNFEESNIKYICSLRHEDSYFNMPEGLRNFKESDEALRIRQSLEYDKTNDKSIQKEQSYLTYKGAKIDVMTKTRREIEIKIGNAHDMLEILNILGFKRVLNVIKERELYETKFNGEEVEILIDYLPDLDQYYMEVEVIIESKRKLEPIRRKLFTFLKQFGISESDSIRKSYLELLLEAK